MEGGGVFLATVFADVIFGFGFIFKNVLNPIAYLASSCFIS